MRTLIWVHFFFLLASIFLQKESFYWFCPPIHHQVFRYATDLTNSWRSLDVKILQILQKLLLDIGIQSRLLIKKVGCPHLIISLLENLQKYKDLIDFSIGYKHKKLEEAIEYLKKDKAHDKEKYWQVLRCWKLNAKSLRSSAKEFNMHWETYRSWVYGMKMPCQIKKDIEVGWVPNDYEKLRQNYSFLPKIVNRL